MIYRKSPPKGMRPARLPTRPWRAQKAARALAVFLTATSVWLAVPGAWAPAPSRAETAALASTPTPPDDLVPETRGRVVEAVDADTVILADGREVRLVGIQTPKLPLGRDMDPWPLAEPARAALADLVAGHEVALAFGGRRRDRHGRHLAHLFRIRNDDTTGLWVQAAMLAQGWARVYSFADNRTAVKSMLRVERAARAAGRGIWADPYYRVRTTDEAHDAVNSFQLVAGRVRATAKVRGRVYLNFGADWREDFTISVPPGAVSRFEDAGIDPQTHEGRWVRVRGWIESYNGPLIEATHPEQIEVIR